MVDDSENIQFLGAMSKLSKRNIERDRVEKAKISKKTIPEPSKPKPIIKPKVGLERIQELLIEMENALFYTAGRDRISVARRTIGDIRKELK